MIQPNVLAIDTTSDYLSLALLRAGAPSGDCYEFRGTAIARTILGEIETLLARAGLPPNDLDVLFVARGPGSFTGTRIGMSVALTLGQVFQRPVIGVDTLSILAAQTDPARRGPFHAVLNCARDEAYHASFRWRHGELDMLDEIRLTTVDLAVEEIGSAPAVVRRFDQARGPHAAALARLKRAPLLYPQPDGLRLLAVGMPIYLSRPGGPFQAPVPLYLKSEAFRTWQPPHHSGVAGVRP